MKRVLLLLVLASLLTGCASALNIGREEPVCKGDGEGGTCIDPMSVYNNRAKILAEYDWRKRGAKTEKEKEPASTIIKSDTPAAPPEGGFEQLPIAVRRTEEVRRNFINSFIDSSGNLVGSFMVHSVRKKGGWMLPDGRELQ